MKDQAKSTMSVPEMAKMLGLKKTDSYWLVHKNYFQTVIVAGKIRIVISSFENWYANQVHYRKVNGPAPSYEKHSDSYSIRDISEMLGISDGSVYDLIARYKIETFQVNYKTRVKKKTFNRWYRNQKHFRTQKDRERDRKAEEASMTLPEMGRLLCGDRNLAYKLIKENDQFVIIEIAGRKRVTKDSFEKWYSSQTEYRKFDDLSKEDQSRVVKEHKDDGLGKALRESGQAFDEDKIWLSLKEASLLIGKSESTILRFIQSGELPAVQVNRSWRIRNDEIRWFLLEHEDKDEGSND